MQVATLRGALRKSRGDGTICIDTDDIVDRSGGGELRSKFSSSSYERRREIEGYHCIGAVASGEF